MFENKHEVIQFSYENVWCTKSLPYDDGAFKSLRVFWSKEHSSGKIWNIFINIESNHFSNTSLEKVPLSFLIGATNKVYYSLIRETDLSKTEYLYFVAV